MCLTSYIDMLLMVINGDSFVMFHVQAFGSWDSGSPHPFDPVAIDRTREINGVGYDAVRRISPGRMVFLSPNAMASIATASYVYPDSDLGGQWLKHTKFAAEFDKLAFIAHVQPLAIAWYIKKGL